MNEFIVYPAIDLRIGKVVRLQQGDPERSTHYADDPVEIAQRWIAEGASWLHVVNLDGAFGDRSLANQNALQRIVAMTKTSGRCRVQFGGGLRTWENIEAALALGVDRIILGTLAVESPDSMSRATARFGAGRIGVGIDARNGLIQVRGWKEATGLTSVDFAKRMSDAGVRTVVYTDIARDGVGTGVDLAGCEHLAQATGLSVIASGGANSLADVKNARAAKLSGIIIGRALYEGRISLKDALTDD